MIALHLGPLHPYARVLVLIFSIGPFVILGLAIWVRARQDRAAALAEEQPSADPADGSDSGG